MALNLPTFKYRNNTKAKQMILNNPVIMESELEEDDYETLLIMMGEDPNADIVEIKNKLDGNSLYVVSGVVILEYTNKETKKNIQVRRQYDISFYGLENLDEQELRFMIYHKLTRQYQNPAKGGRSDVKIVALSFRSYEVPNDFEPHHRMRLYDPDFIKYTFFSNFHDVKYNTGSCVFDYLLSELSKFYKTINKNKLIKQLKNYTKDIFTYGISIQNLKKFLDTHYKRTTYYILYPDNKIIQKENQINTTQHPLTFYINNSHLYPITHKQVQTQITKSRSNNINLLLSLENQQYTNYIYMENDQTEFIENTNYILNENLDYREYRDNLINETNNAIEFYTDYCFKHPTKNILIHKYNDFHDRQKLFNSLKDKYKFEDFNNESYPSISKLLLKKLGTLTNSYYNKQTHYYLSKYYAKPIIDTNTSMTHDILNAVDISKHYSHLFYDSLQKTKIPVYDYHHIVEPFYVENSSKNKITLGEYYIKPFEYKNIKMGGYFVHYYTVKKLLKWNIIKLSDITHQIKTKKYASPKVLKKFVQHTSKLSIDHFKQLNNMLNGTFHNNTIKHTKQNFFTTDINTMTYLILETQKENYNFSHELTNSNFFLKRWKTKPNYENTSSYYRSTLSLSILEVIKLMKKIKGEIVKVKTDCITFYGDNFKYDDYNDMGDVLNNLGKYKPEYIGDDIRESRYIPLEFKEYINKENNIIITGSGGSGKSYKVINEAKENNNILFLAPTNKAVIELQNKANKQNKNIDNWHFSTIAKLFEPVKTSYRKKLNILDKYNNIIVDEAMMINANDMRILINTESKLLLLGDVNQLPPINNKYIEKHNILSSYVGKFFNIEHQIYNPKYARYGQETYDIIHKFNKTGKYSDLKKLQTINHNKIYPFYICAFNKTRQKYTKKCCDHYYKKSKEYTFIYQDKKENYKIGVNMPVICTQDINDIKNNWTTRIKDITENNVSLKDDTIYSINDFLSHFLPFYCSTVHKVQSGKIETEYAILDINSTHTMITKNWMYTALTRCTDYKNIYIDKISSSNKDKIFHSESYDNNLINCTMKIITEEKKEEENKKSRSGVDLSKIKTECFRTDITTKKKSTMYINKNNIRFIYYEDDIRKEKKLSINKQGLTQTIEKFNNNNYIVDCIKNNTNNNIKLDNNKLLIVF